MEESPIISNNPSLMVPIDLNPILISPDPLLPYTFFFNPTVAHWKDNLFLCAYRGVSRNIKAQKVDPEFDPNHPWKGGPGSKFWWKTKVDSTFFSILKIENRTVTGVRALQIIIDGESKPSYPAVDARLLHLVENNFILSSNTFVSGTGLIVSCVLTLNNEGTELLARKTELVCDSLSIQGKTEKNWSFWIYNNNLFFSYNIVPTHEVYKAQIKDFVIKCLPDKISAKTGYLGLLEKCYNHGKPDKIVFISLTTPAIPSRTRKDRYLGVGHLKLKWKEINEKNFEKNSLLLSFYEKESIKYKHHPALDYFMFIYEFNPANYEITRMSDFFIPWVQERTHSWENKETGYLLSFPSGLEYSSNDLMIFYGDHDVDSKILFLSPEMLESLLKIRVIEDDSIAACSLVPGPDFFILPKECKSTELSVCKNANEIKWVEPPNEELIKERKSIEEFINTNIDNPIKILERLTRCYGFEKKIIRKQIGKGAQGAIYRIKFTNKFYESKLYVAKRKELRRDWMDNICSGIQSLTNNFTNQLFPVPKNSFICNSLITEYLISLYVSKLFVKRESVSFAETFTLSVCDREAYIFMEKLEGSLYQLFEKKPSIAELTFLYNQIVFGIAAYQSCGIIHNDLLCGNILFEETKNSTLFPSIKNAEFYKYIIGSKEYVFEAKNNSYIPKIADWGFSVKFPTQDLPIIIGNKDLLNNTYKDFFPNFYNTSFDLLIFTADFYRVLANNSTFVPVISKSLEWMLQNIPGGSLNEKYLRIFPSPSKIPRLKREHFQYFSHISPLTLIHLMYNPIRYDESKTVIMLNI